MKQLAPAPVKAPPMPSITSKVNAQTVLRKCGCGGTCQSCEEEKMKHAGVVQRQSSSNGGGVSGGALAPAVSSRIAAASHGGSPLPAPVNQSMSDRFGRDFSGVRIHSNSTADSLSRQLGAEAFTTGSNIFFAAGRYNPYTTPGQRLLAHELTHVVQQGDSAGSVQTKLELGAPDTAAEREADRVAEQVMRDQPVPRFSAGVPLQVQRQPRDTRGLHIAAGIPGGRGHVTGNFITVPDNQPNTRLLIPTEKIAWQFPGDSARILERYRALADRQGLRTTHAGRAQLPGYTETDTLRERWAVSRGYVNWAAFAADPTSQPSGGHANLTQLCSPDHIVELQLGGQDDPNNYRLLERSRNSRAGGPQGFWGEINDIRTNLNAGSDDVLVFQPQGIGVRSSDGSDDPCLRWEGEHGRLNPFGQVPMPPRAGGPTAAPMVRALVGGLPTNITYQGTQVQETSRYAVPGLQLDTINVVAPGHEYRAVLSPRLRRLPVAPNRRYQYVLSTGAQTAPNAAPPDMRLAPGSGLAMAFRFLSEANLPIFLESGQMKARGSFRPTLPILRNVDVNLAVENEELNGGVSVPADALRRALPIPGLTIDPVTIQVQIANGEFSATGGFGFRYGNFAEGRLTAQLSNAAGFSAQGTVNLHIPAIDQAQGEAWIRNGRFGGRLTLGRNKVNFPGVQSANLVVELTDGQLTGTGTILLAIPGLRDTTLRFTANSRGQYSITGTATGNIPGLRDPRIEIAYANGGLSGTGTAGFIIPGLEGGNLTLRYANGQFSGSASIDYRRGRLTGRVTANLSPAFRLSGRGELGYEIAPGLTALVGLELRENGTARVSGELRLPDPIEIFAARTFDRRLFGVSIDIPIFGISFGSRSIGIIANISAALNARAGIGPGQIRRPRITASFDPSSDQGSTSFQASAELYVPASAELAVVLSGGIGVSLLIVKALGGIQATGSVGLHGALAVPIEIKYLAGKFTVDGAAELTAEPKLRFNLDAFARVEADLLLTTIELYSKTWHLAAFEWGSNFRIGLRFPVHYVFGESFRLSLDRLQFIAPEINARQIIRDLLPK
jgi:hypothetical protein